MAQGISERVVGKTSSKATTNSQDESPSKEKAMSQDTDIESNKDNNTSSQGEGENNDKGHASSMTKSALVVGLQMGNIMCWYWTNGMNGIAMQAFAGDVGNVTKQGGAVKRFYSTLLVTSGVTCLQLLLGAMIGRILLLLINRQITWQQIILTRSIPLASLHAAGSLATNLGFMYGKASLVQVIKLLEPFETLILSQILFKEGNCSIGIVSSMILVVGAAMSLLKLQSTPPLPQAIIFALLSGLTLSTRNVLQRKHHHTTAAAKSWSKLEKSVVQFTQLSFFSGLWMAAASMLFWLLIILPPVYPSWQVFLWHPLYNVFSMITLGFCSALTHSLLNAGKRVFAICMAMLWFSEALDAPTMSGLLAVATGGSWYSWEGKRKIDPSTTGRRNEFYKLFFSMAGLAALFAFHGVMTKIK